ncbi:MAG: Ribosomal protein S9, archaeal [Candidatus Syntrophoarchaeum caldarius]|uniref:Small ribosomal subunit protein uS9 n=1 Tax=Candidatus Syntropharchaeum caldarium TaxID=1838285 RepID=A0A1F2PCM0_9EURY|nr:MAG: Ribosomal protein S9, archaeal [Candidatus Syntrophoarchaeum caldarius]
MKKIINSSGKRKTAIARAVFKPGKGRVRIDKVPLDILRPELARLRIMEPLLIAQYTFDKDYLKGIDIDVNVRGGGFMGQANAVRTAIARGLVEWIDDIEERSQLKSAFLEFDRNLLVNDMRRKEAKKFGGRGARARKQKSYR